MNIIETSLNFTSLSYGNKPQKIILHHAEATNCSIYDINSWHKNNGWAGCGYNYLVRKDGSIYRGRPENAIGAHCSGQNSVSIGICFEGAFGRETMSTTQYNAGVALIQNIRSRYGNLPIYGHKDLNATSCPGSNFPLSQFKSLASYSGSGTKNTPSSGSSLLERAKNYVGSRCKELQQKLIAKGYDCGGYGADGIFGQGTLDSLLKFQRDNGLVADGLAGPDTFRKLNSNSTGSNWVRRLQSYCNSQGYSNQTVDGIPGPNTVAGCPLIAMGSQGEIVKLFQEKLVSLGFNTNGVDGIFGNGTFNAAKSFQSRYGLTADGIVGTNTWRKIIYL